MMEGYSGGCLMNVVVTGATGFIGLHLVKSLLLNGHEVTAVLHERNIPAYMMTDALHVVWGDLERLESVHDAVAHSDVVCHLAGFIPPKMQSAWYAKECLLYNSLFTLEVAKFASENATRFILLSSGQIYKYSATPVSEDAPVHPVEYGAYYLASKLLSELYVEHLQFERALPTCILRIGNCYGPGMKASSVVSYFMQCAAAGQPLTVFYNGTPTHDFVYVDDVADAIVSAVQSGVVGIYNIGSGCATSLQELAETVVEVYSDKDISVEVDSTDAHVSKGFSALSIEKARRELDYSPRSLKDGLSLYRRQLERNT